MFRIFIFDYTTLLKFACLLLFHVIKDKKESDIKEKYMDTRSPMKSLHENVSRTDFASLVAKVKTGVSL